MDAAVSFINSVTRMWLDSGVLIPALLTGYYFSARPFWRFLGTTFIVAVVTHVLIVVLYKLDRAMPSRTMADIFTDKIIERLAAFLLASLAVYGAGIALRKIIK